MYNRNLFLQLVSCVWLFATPWTTARQAPLSFMISLSLLKLKFIESVMLPKNVTLCCHLLILPSIFPNIRVFSNESSLRIRWPKYWSFSFGISSSNEYSGFISFRIDWFDLLAVQRTLKSLLQHHNLKISILWCSAFFNGPAATYRHNYWKNNSFDYINLCQQNDVSSFFLFNTLSRFVIAFLPRSKCLLISWLQSPSAVILEPQ